MLRDVYDGPLLAFGSWQFFFFIASQSYLETMHVANYSLVYYVCNSTSVDITLNLFWMFPFHDNVIKWKHIPRYQLFARRIYRSLVVFPHKGQWRGALLFSLISAPGLRIEQITEHLAAIVVVGPKTLLYIYIYIQIYIYEVLYVCVCFRAHTVNLKTSLLLNASSSFCTTFWVPLRLDTRIDFDFDDVVFYFHKNN